MTKFFGYKVSETVRDVSMCAPVVNYEILEATIILLFKVLKFRDGNNSRGNCSTLGLFILYITSSGVSVCL